MTKIQQLVLFACKHVDIDTLPFRLYHSFTTLEQSGIVYHKKLSGSEYRQLFKKLKEKNEQELAGCLAFLKQDEEDCDTTALQGLIAEPVEDFIVEAPIEDPVEDEIQVEEEDAETKAMDVDREDPIREDPILEDSIREGPFREDSIRDDPIREDPIPVKESIIYKISRDFAEKLMERTGAVNNKTQQLFNTVFAQHEAIDLESILDHLLEKAEKKKKGPRYIGSYMQNTTNFLITLMSQMDETEAKKHAGNLAFYKDTLDHYRYVCASFKAEKMLRDEDRDQNFKEDEWDSMSRIHFEEIEYAVDTYTGKFISAVERDEYASLTDDQLRTCIRLRLYTIDNAPRRDEYRSLHIVPDVDNWYNKKTGEITLNNFATGKAYAEYVFKVSKGTKILLDELAYRLEERGEVGFFNIPTKEQWDEICRKDFLEALNFLPGYMGPIHYKLLRPCYVKYKQKLGYLENVLDRAFLGRKMGSTYWESCVMKMPLHPVKGNHQGNHQGDQGDQGAQVAQEHQGDQEHQDQGDQGDQVAPAPSLPEAITEAIEAPVPIEAPVRQVSSIPIAQIVHSVPEISPISPLAGQDPVDPRIEQVRIEKARIEQLEAELFERKQLEAEKERKFQEQFAVLEAGKRLEKTVQQGTQMTSKLGFPSTEQEQEQDRTETEKKPKRKERRKYTVAEIADLEYGLEHFGEDYHKILQWATKESKSLKERTPAELKTKSENEYIVRTNKSIVLGGFANVVLRPSCIKKRKAQDLGGEREQEQRKSPKLQEQQQQQQQQYHEPPKQQEDDELDYGGGISV
jgi:hypothetical protein